MADPKPKKSGTVSVTIRLDDELQGALDKVRKHTEAVLADSGVYVKLSNVTVVQNCIRTAAAGVK